MLQEIKYQVLNEQLSEGDTLLLMSDGLPELKNPKGEIFDYNRVEGVFRDENLVDHRFYHIGLATREQRHDDHCNHGDDQFGSIWFQYLVQPVQQFLVIHHSQCRVSMLCISA